MYSMEVGLDHDPTYPWFLDVSLNVVDGKIPPASLLTQENPPPKEKTSCPTTRIGEVFFCFAQMVFNNSQTTDILGCAFKYFLFSPLFGENSRFD